MQPNDTVPTRRSDYQPRVECTCETCGTAFLVLPRLKNKKRFCSLPCAATGRTKREPRSCETCEATFLARASQIRQGIGRFCSVPCHDEAQRSFPLADRLWAPVDKNGPIPEHRAEFGNCWTRNAYLRAGYSRIYRPFPHAVRAHRVAWELATGETLTPDDVIGHICDVRHCVRNDITGTYIVAGIALPRCGHLFKGTHEDNRLDMDEKGRRRFVLDQYVKRGEESQCALLTEDNVREIRALYAAGGISQQSLADRFGVNQSNISHVILRRSWSHVQ